VKAKSNPQDKELAKEICRRNEVLKSERAPWDTLAQEIADYVMPRKSQINTKKTESVEGFTDDIYNQEAIRCNGILAAGQKHWLMEGRWFQYTPGEVETQDPETGEMVFAESDDSLKMWYSKVTEKMQKLFAKSNLYTEVHEMLLDRGACPSALLYTEEGKKSLFNFKAERFGTYSIAEDCEGNVDTVFREFTLTARQAVQKFGIENVSKEVREAHEGEGGKRKDQKFEFIHAIYPREDKDRDTKRLDGVNKPIASIYVCKKGQHIFKNDGYDEMPAMVTRFLKWGDGPYGYCPGVDALPTIRQVNFIEQQMDALAEIKAFPRFLYPSDMEGEFDLRAGCGSPMDPNKPNGKPETWGTEGEYDIGLERVSKKEELIRKAYMVDLFQMLQAIDGGKMTALEVSERVAEKIPQFSPTFQRLVPELLTPLLTRCFAIAYRAGVLGKAPDSAFADAGDGTRALRVPEVSFTSKLALSIKAAENNALLQMVQLWMPLAEGQPDLLDNLDLDTALRDSADNFGLPALWKRSAEKVAAMRAERAKAAQAQQASELAQGTAKAAKDMAGADPEMKRAVGM
jgi:hypothetical protein